MADCPDPIKAIERHFSMEGPYRYNGHVSPNEIAEQAVKALKQAGFVILHQHDAELEPCLHDTD